MYTDTFRLDNDPTWDSQGENIVAIKMDPDYTENGALLVDFDGGTRLVIFDADRQCCEERYLHTDDDLAQFVGATFLGLSRRSVEKKEEDYEVHEIVFIAVKTSLGHITLETHNVHNGYYGGFDISVRLETIEQKPI